jgi:glyoxalase family protein
MKEQLVKGIHHITAIAGSVSDNVRFYTQILGLRFIKKTINYDSPDTWHLYYGDETGNPGSAITFFPFKGIAKGKPGNRSVNVILYSIGENSLAFWMERLKSYNVDFQGPFHRFDHSEEFIHFCDFDGMEIELVANNQDQRQGWQNETIPQQHAIKGFYSALLSYSNAETSLGFLTQYMNHTFLKESKQRIRLYSGEEKPGNFIDLVSHPSYPDHLAGSGTVHHIAFGTRDEQSQLEIKNNLNNHRYHVSPVMDRQYFRSIYFREPGGVLFEVATEGPGFLIDETPEKLGSSLRLPAWLESQRDQIEAGLPPIE